MTVKGKILIVEDDRAICNFMRRVLEANGYEALIVGTGREAISLLASHCPDVVILDLGLPDIDGMEVLQNLRRWSLMPVVVVSARTDEREKVRALDAGARRIHQRWSIAYFKGCRKRLRARNGL